jgi:hypothetical protein
LRSGLHTAFNDRKCTLYPRADDGYVVHMLEPTPDIGQLYHNVKHILYYSATLDFSTPGLLGRCSPPWQAFEQTRCVKIPSSHQEG